MVTIDDEDAKDLDDAVSVELLKNGSYRLGVHIADVSNYVREGTPLDKEAAKRGTSVYLAGKVLPMLPVRLSNGICSLDAHYDRLAFSVIMVINDRGSVMHHDIFESVINVDERMTYADVSAILEKDDPVLRSRYSALLPMFEKMKQLALILYRKRTERGAIDFDFDEAKIVIDKDGKVTDIKRYKATVANRIIEEFMIVCNETVAERFAKDGIPFVYRVHEYPDKDKIKAFAEFVKNFGHRLKNVGKMHPRNLQYLMSQVKGSPEDMIIGMMMLRSLQKARYSHENLGHFGLAAEYYCHFTSPIRRYPDLIIHRLIKERIKGSLTKKRKQSLLLKLPEVALLCSEREIAATEAERDVEDLKKAEYMKQFQGRIYTGMICNATAHGMYVELANTVQGMVHVSDMTDDYYVFDEKRFCLRGKRTKKVYGIGDKLDVQVARVDVESRQISFVIAGLKDITGRTGKTGRTGRTGRRGKR